MEMMGGMLGGAFGAVGSIVGASIAADAQRYSANTNWQIALMNYYARERERFETRMEAQRIEAKQNLGTTDAEGTRTQFVPGEGWVVEETGQKKALRARQLAEEMQRLGPDAQMRRDQLERNQIRQIKEEDRASALFDEMRKQPEVTPTLLQNILYNKATTGINRAFDDTLAIGSRQALRTGGDPGPIFKEIASARADQLRDAAVASEAQALQMAPAINAENDKVKANLYNLFATRAGAMPDVSFSPQAIDSSNLQSAMRASSMGSDAGLKAAMMEGGRLPYVPPNYGPANLAGAIGAAGQGFFRNMGNAGMFNEGGGGGGTGNLYNEIAERTRGTFGAFS